MNVLVNAPTPAASRSSIKTSGVIGARGKGDSLELRGNFNHGNFIHGAAARRLLASYQELDLRFRNPLSDKDVAEIRGSISHIVMVQATLIALDQTPPEQALAVYRSMADNIERLKLPVVMLGMGVLVRPGAELEYRVHEDLLRMLRVVSAHSTNMAVRGEFTADTCRRLGLDNVKVIGCQSLFWHRQPTLSHLLEGADAKERPTAFNYTNPLLENHLVNQAMASDFSLIGQGNSAEEILVQRYEIDGQPIPYLPRTLTAFKQKLVDRDRYESWVRKRFFQFSDPDRWIEHLRRYRGVYGTRFHGNMAGYIAGIPALWITHDVRTNELCEHFRLPSMSFDSVKDGVDFETLYERMDYSECAKVYPERYRAMVDYLNEAGVNHTLLAPPVGDGDAATAGKLDTIQIRTDTAYNRYPRIFKTVETELLERPDAKPAEMRILSFGCSKGDEVFALADKYFPEARLLGVDVVTENLQKARMANKSPDRIFFEFSNDETLDAWKPFDAIFAMSVLCSWPGSKDKDDITDIFSFAQFEAAVDRLDRTLKVGGVLAIYNANYRFQDTRFSDAYERIKAPTMINSGFVSKFDKDCRRRPEFDRDNEIVFRKTRETAR